MNYPKVQVMKVDYFDRPDFGKRYEELRAENHPGWFSEAHYREEETAIEKLLARYGVPAGGRFLELGCGAGNITLFMANKGFEAYGIDTALRPLHGREREWKAQWQAQISALATLWILHPILTVSLTLCSMGSVFTVLLGWIVRPVWLTFFES